MADNNNSSIYINKNINNIVELLNSTIHSNYKPTTNSTKRHITARLREGFALSDFEAVIHFKAKEWRGTDFEKFLRPETLFGSKFESYLQQARKGNWKDRIETV